MSETPHSLYRYSWSISGWAGVRLNPDGAALIAMTANSAAYTIEIVRAGIVGVDRGQWEAGKVLGLSLVQIYSSIVLPQALKIIYWPLASQFILIMLASSVVSVIATSELSHLRYQHEDLPSLRGICRGNGYLQD